MQIKVPISIVVPVGPYPRHREHLPEFVKSVEEQTAIPSEVVFIDDGGGLIAGTERLVPPAVLTTQTRLVRNRWNLGIANSFNVGVGSTNYDLVILACADDRLLPRCVELCWAAYQREREMLGYYFFGLRYRSTGQEQNCANGSCMVTRELWRYTGGFFTKTGGADDHVFISALLGSRNRGMNKARLIQVSDEIIYEYNDASNGGTSTNVWPAIEALRDLYTETWVPPGERVNQV